MTIEQLSKGLSLSDSIRELEMLIVNVNQEDANLFSILQTIDRYNDRIARRGDETPIVLHDFTKEIQQRALDIIYKKLNQYNQELELL